MASLRKIVVIRPGALGDAVVTLPVLEALGAAWPDAERLVIGHPVFGLAVEGGMASAWVAFDDGRLVSLFGSGGACDVVAGADLCLVYGSGEEGALEAGLRRSGVRQVIPWPVAPGATHIIDHLLQALAPLEIAAPARQARLLPSGPWRDEARRVLSERGIKPGYVVIHPGSGGRRKQWPAERFAEVARRLGGPVAWLLGPAEAEQPELREAGRDVGAVLEGLSLRGLAGLVAGCRVCVGNDSGVSHLAAAVGAPTVAVFGPTDPAVWAPRGERVAVLGGPARGGLLATTVGEVVEAAARLASPPTP